MTSVNLGSAADVVAAAGAWEVEAEEKVRVVTSPFSMTDPVFVLAAGGVDDGFAGGFSAGCVNCAVT